MNNEQLVNLITKEVMIRLNAMLGENNIVDEKRVLVLEREDALSPELVSALSEKGYIVDCLDNKKFLNSYEGIILQTITNQEMANISNGIEGSVKEKSVIEALLLGSRIYSLEEGVEYKKFVATSNKQFLSLFMSYKDKLKSYGIHFVELNNLLSFLENKYDCSVKVPCCIETNEVKAPVCIENSEHNYVDLSNKKLISEVELRNTLKAGIKKVLVSRKCVVTPLAIDFARINKLEINKQK